MEEVDTIITQVGVDNLIKRLDMLNIFLEDEGYRYLVIDEAIKCLEHYLEIVKLADRWGYFKEDRKDNTVEGCIMFTNLILDTFKERADS